MTALLSRLFVKNYQDTTNPKVRTAYGTMVSITGIILNISLFAAKFVVGTLFGAISIVGDAVNNLSDAGTQIISLISFRIAAKPGSEDYSAFTVFCQYYAEPKLLFDVPAHCFMPQPKVTSAVIQLNVRKERNWGIDDEKIFFRLVRASFAQRRKKLANGLASGFPELGKNGATEVIEAAGFDANVRGETLSIPEFARIANEIARRKKND